MKKLIIVLLCMLSVGCAGNVSGPGGEQGSSSTSGEYAYRTGMQYLIGQNVQRDTSRAFSYFQQAANRGNPYAQSELAYMYASGEGTTQNYQSAFEWYQKAANQGLASAQFTLGQMYAHGLGVQVDKAQAHAWYKKAASSGFGPAKKAL